ncbi:FAST kinase domain-containing protein 4 [Wyeomyia smithii]|uniref:FAST kinase domain-containing protein 4 n=1 Tax=Wyeomyia smithii TaxID=174621 RepID=UPI002467BED1|nr:FAST kinase domain-containing protein 4 [Wyeomyia smithii]
MLSLYRFSRSTGFRIMKRNFSAPVAPFASHVTPDEGKIEDNKKSDVSVRQTQHAKSLGDQHITKNPIVAAAFASLLHENRLSGKTTTVISNGIDEKIFNASTVNDLLAIPGRAKVSRKQALKIVSILAEWSSIKKVKLSEFENDSRFIQLCNVLGRTSNRNNGTLNKSSFTINRTTGSNLHVDDLQTVLGVTANDEAAKLIAGLTMSQMIKVMTSLAQKKKRSTPLLRSLAFNISSSSSQLNLKECGDLLYAMANLNFRDSVLAAKVCTDVEAGLAENEDKPGSVGSILTSLSLLRYRDTAILDVLSDWIVSKSEICKPAHVGTFLLSLATLNYEPNNMDNVQEKLVNHLMQSDFIKSVDWLNTVWSLAVLNCVSQQQLVSVLNSSFISCLEKERSGELSPAIKMKLLNLNAVANNVVRSDSDFSTLNPNDPKLFVPIECSKSKRVLITGMLDALKSLLPSENHVRINQRTTMGFAIDAECVLDSRCLPLAVDKEHADAKRIALLVHDYHDMCQGPHPSLNGVQALTCRLLEKSGYSVLSIPYSEFNTSDKLLKRVEYLQKRFKTLVSLRV